MRTRAPGPPATQTAASSKPGARVGSSITIRPFGWQVTTSEIVRNEPLSSSFVAVGRCVFETLFDARLDLALRAGRDFISRGRMTRDPPPRPRGWFLRPIARRARSLFESEVECMNKSIGQSSGCNEGYLGGLLGN